MYENFKNYADVLKPHFLFCRLLCAMQGGMFDSYIAEGLPVIEMKMILSLPAPAILPEINKAVSRKIVLFMLNN